MSGRARDTIVALASGRGPAAIAVVRMSGPDAFAATRALVGSLPETRRASLRAVRGSDGALIDRALVLAFAGPASATGEDVVEFHVHGGVAVIGALLATMCARDGVRVAEPGEFTRRAFDCGRLDLAQVEALADLVSAETEAQRMMAVAGADGVLGRAVAGWRDRLVSERVALEAALDFSDDVDGVEPADGGQLAAVRDEIVAVVARAGAARRVRDGLTVVLAGAPNVGKSSLLNALAGEAIAIVSARAGTTRDPVAARLELGGALVTVVDTAGLRESDDPIEQEGVQRALARAGAADLVLALSDGGAPYPDGVRVRTKVDLGGVDAAAAFSVSAVTGTGLDGLLAWLRDWARSVASDGGSVLVANERQGAALAGCVDALEAAIAAPDDVVGAEMVALATRALGRVVGSVDVEDVLDGIFARFCVGK